MPHASDHRRRVHGVEAAVLVPIKAFHQGKQRLSGHLAAADRERLARAMAVRVVAAGGGLPVFVACDDDAVAAWATDHGAEVLWTPGLGLNGAIDHGVTTITGKGIDHVVISHSDLPLADRLDRLVRPGAVTLVPDRRRDGTNVIARPCALTLPASYGGGSFRRHLALALETGVPITVCPDRHLAIDVDTLDDCRHPLIAPFVADVIGARP